MSRRWLSPSVLGAAVIGASFVTLTMFLAAELNIWQDEWYSLRTTSAGPLIALHRAVEFERIPPLYPLLLDVWRGLDGSVLFARALSIACVAAAALASGLFAQRYFRAVPPLAVAATVAFNPFSIYAALEIRLYALVLALSAGLLLTFFDGFVAQRPSQRARLLYVLLAVAGAYTQYFLAAFPLGGALALAALRAHRQLRPYGTALALIAAASLPIALFLPMQLATVRSTAAHDPTAALLPLAESAVSFALPHDWLGNWFSNRLNLAYDAALLTLAGLLFGSAIRPGRVATALAVIVATLLAFFAAAPALFAQTLVFPRHAAPLVLPCVLLAFAAIDVAGRRRALVLRVYLGTYALFTMFALVATYRGLAKAGDFARAAAFIESRERRGENIYAFDPEMEGPLRFYYRGAGTIVPLPSPQDFTRFDATKFVFRNSAAVRGRLGPMRRGTRLLLYRGDVCYEAGDSFGCRFLEDVVREDYRVLSGVVLESATVRELVRR